MLPPGGIPAKTYIALIIHLICRLVQHEYLFFWQKMGLVQFWVAASSAAPRLSLPKAWGWQNSQSGATIPKSFGFEAATPYETTNNITDLFEPCPKMAIK